jgi:hypothetical protein
MRNIIVMEDIEKCKRVVVKLSDKRFDIYHIKEVKVHRPTGSVVLYVCGVKSKVRIVVAPQVCIATGAIGAVKLNNGVRSKTYYLNIRTLNKTLFIEQRKEEMPITVKSLLDDAVA